jgi:hypothetical protein
MVQAIIRLCRDKLGKAPGVKIPLEAVGSGLHLYDRSYPLGNAAFSPLLSPAPVAILATLVFVFVTAVVMSHARAHLLCLDLIWLDMANSPCKGQ